MVAKINVCLLVFFLLGSSAVAQLSALAYNSDVESIRWGAKLDSIRFSSDAVFKIVKSDSAYIYIYFRSSSFTYSLFTSGVTRFFIRHNRQTGQNERLYVQRKINEHWHYPTFYKAHEDRIDVIYSYYDKQTAILYLYREKIDYTTFRSNDDITKVAEIAIKNNPADYFSLHLVTFVNNQYLIRYKISSKSGDVFGLWVFDENFTKLWDASAFAFTSQGYNYESDYTIDNEGNVYALQRNFKNRNDINKFNARGKLWLVCYPKGGLTPVTRELKLNDDVIITSHQMSINPEGKVVCAGLFSKEGTTSAIGAYSFILTPLLDDKMTVNMVEFSIDMLNKGFDDSSSKRRTRNFNNSKDFDRDFNYIMNKIHFRNDGGFDVVAEKFSRVRTYRDGVVVSDARYYDDLFVLAFHADGSLNWTQKIPKFTYVSNDASITGSYHLSHDSDDSMHFIYNLYNDSYSIQKAKTVMMTLDKFGNESFREVEGKALIAKYICPELFFRENESEFITVMYHHGFLLAPTKKNQFTLGTWSVGR
jgi:hypothetical protein